VGLLPESGGGHGGFAAAASPLTSPAASPSPGQAATTTPGGYAAKRFVLTDLLEECGRPEGRWLWENAGGSHFVFLKGGTATIYVVEVDRDRLVIASHHRGSPVEDVRELDAITASLDIEPQGRP